MWDNPEILKKAFPLYLKEDIDAILKRTIVKPEVRSYEIRPFKVMLDAMQLHIPERHCFFEIYRADEDALTDIQKEVISCFYTRHCDGHIREKHLRKIILSKNKWVVPYVIRILGEYVIEILQVIYENLDHLDVNIYKEFIEENIDFYNLTKARVQSYWNCYYRTQYKNENDYVGFKILNFLDSKLDLIK